VVVPPSVTQNETLASFQEQVTKQNYDALRDYAYDLETWAANAQIYHGLGMPVGTIPRVPGREILHRTYADHGGATVPDAEGTTSEKFYCWTWQTSDGAWLGELPQLPR
jgi:hypothetical protein